MKTPAVDAVQHANTEGGGFAAAGLRLRPHIASAKDGRQEAA